MLVIRRRAGEKLLIGDEIEIQVLEVSGPRVKLGIVAPDSVAIVRYEARATRDQNVAAARSTESSAIVSLLRNISKSHMIAAHRQIFDAETNSKKS